jgi:hypothetical protein
MGIYDRDWYRKEHKPIEPLLFNNTPPLKRPVYTQDKPKRSSGIKLSSFIVLIVCIAYVLAVGYNVVTIQKKLNEEFITENGVSLTFEVASRLGIAATVGIIWDMLSRPRNAASVLQDERVVRELANVLFDWYAPVKWPPVLSVSKEIEWAMISSRIRNTSADAHAGDYAHVQSVALNVRAGPSADYNVLTRLSKNTRVQIIDKSGAWWKNKESPP